METLFLQLKRRAIVFCLSCSMFACGASVVHKPVNGADRNEFAGIYVGTFSGYDRGVFTIEVASDGSISGGGTSEAIGQFNLVGTVAAQGEVRLAGASRNASSGAAFVGAISSGDLLGTWRLAVAAEEGTFKGTRANAVGQQTQAGEYHLG